MWSKTGKYDPLQKKKNILNGCIYLYMDNMLSFNVFFSYFMGSIFFLNWIFNADNKKHLILFEIKIKQKW